MNSYPDDLVEQLIRENDDLKSRISYLEQKEGDTIDKLHELIEFIENV